MVRLQNFTLNVVGEKKITLMFTESFWMSLRNMTVT